MIKADGYLDVLGSLVLFTTVLPLYNIQLPKITDIEITQYLIVFVHSYFSSNREVALISVSL